MARRTSCGLVLGTASAAASRPPVTAYASLGATRAAARNSTNSSCRRSATAASASLLAAAAMLSAGAAAPAPRVQLSNTHAVEVFNVRHADKNNTRHRFRGLLQASSCKLIYACRCQGCLMLRRVIACL